MLGDENKFQDTARDTMEHELLNNEIEAYNWDSEGTFSGTLTGN